MSDEPVDATSLLSVLEEVDAEVLKTRLIESVKKLLVEKYVNREAVSVIQELIK